MKNIKGKKILVIGGNPLETEIVKRVKERGAIAVVADYYENYDDAPAKMFADEVWNVDWSDTQKLKEYCIQNGVEGAIAGFSEFKVEALIRLTSTMGWPCYITQEQLDVTSDKDKFKAECEKYGIPIVPQFNSVEEVNSFPVIVKPVDRGGSIGISVCCDKSELEVAYQKAIEMSPSSKVIIEKYLGNLRKIDLYYLIQKGKPTLFSTSDTIMSAHPPKGLEILQLGWIYPSKHHGSILQKVDSDICNLLKGIGINNGYITISGFIDENSNIYIFETGLRLSGELSYKRMQQLTGDSYLDMLIDIAVCGTTDDVSCAFDDKQKEFMFVGNFFLKNGHIVAKVDSFKNLNIEYVDLLFSNKKIDYKGSLLQKASMVFISCKEKDELLVDLKYVNENCDILDESGQSLIACKSTIQDLESYFESKI